MGKANKASLVERLLSYGEMGLLTKGRLDEEEAIQKVSCLAEEMSAALERLPPSTRTPWQLFGQEMFRQECRSVIHRCITTWSSCDRRPTSIARETVSSPRVASKACGYASHRCHLWARLIPVPHRQLLKSRHLNQRPKCFSARAL